MARSQESTQWSFPFHPCVLLAEHVFFALKCHAPKLREVVCLSYFYVNNTVKYETSRILI